MAFEDQIKSFAQRCVAVKNSVMTEEATKTSLIMPFFQILGYEVFNPQEFIPEFTADVGIKKGEKIDYAIMMGGDPIILIEAKSVTEDLQKHDSQLFRYFGTTKAKFAILTNGLLYRFYTDLEEPNKMDLTPFLEVNMGNLKDSQIAELKKFNKENFDIAGILDTASELKYMGLIRIFFKEQLANPSDAFVKFVLACDVFQGQKTQNVIEKFKPIVKKTFSLFVNEIVNDRIQVALKEEDAKQLPQEDEPQIETPSEEAAPLVVTTEEELQAYYIIKSMLFEQIQANRILYKDTQTYFGINVDGKVTKWIARLYLKESSKTITIRALSGDTEKIQLDSIEDLYQFKSNFINALKTVL